MDAMILAAGLGTRLRPLTDTIPKALVDIGGVTMLERVARRLVDAGATRLIVNVHHHADVLRRFIADHDLFGAEVVISDESDLLRDTGGALAYAAPFFRRDAPFLLHNVDVVSDIDLRSLYRAHCESGPLATLAVMNRDTSRYLLFDQSGLLCGYGNERTGMEKIVRPPAGATERLGFSGIHAVSPRIFELLTEQGIFSIIEVYLRLAAAGERIEAFRVDGARWTDIGKPEQLAAVRMLHDGNVAGN
jgi:NDP-sugar pyrophosphorylase family protein